MYQIFKLDGGVETTVGRPTDWYKAYAKYNKLETKENEAAINEDRPAASYSIGKG